MGSWDDLLELKSRRGNIFVSHVLWLWSSPRLVWSPWATGGPPCKSPAEAFRSPEYTNVPMRGATVQARLDQNPETFLHDLAYEQMLHYTGSPRSDWLMHAGCVYLEEKPLECRAGVWGQVFDLDVGETVKQQQGEATDRPEPLATDKKCLLRLLSTEPQPAGVTDTLWESYTPPTVSMCAGIYTLAHMETQEGFRANKCSWS